jgi:hypothetical protein
MWGSKRETPNPRFLLIRMVSCRLRARPGQTIPGASLDSEVRSNHSLRTMLMDWLPCTVVLHELSREKRNVVLDLDLVVLDRWKDRPER